MEILKILLIVGLVQGQLNFDGNPRTDNTEYTAEESHLSERSSRQNEISRVVQTERTEPQKLYPVYQKVAAAPTRETKKPTEPEPTTKTNIAATQKVQGDAVYLSSDKETSRQYKEKPHVMLQAQRPVDPAEMALKTFLNSRTPEESNLSLDYYLRSKQLQASATGQVPQFQTTDAKQQIYQSAAQFPASNQIGQNSASFTGFHQQTAPYGSSVNFDQQLPKALTLTAGERLQDASSSQLHQEQIAPNLVGGGTLQFGAAPQQQIPHSTMMNNHEMVQQGPVGPYGLQNMQNNGYQQHHLHYQVPDIQTIPDPNPSRIAMQHQRTRLMPIPMGINNNNPPMRSDITSAAAWRQRMRRIRGQPTSFHPQSRIAPASIYKVPSPVPYKYGRGPVEVIYTKPPGFHSGPPSGHYEDASGWFPEVDHPAAIPTKDTGIYYSQLYAQSYDPHYYNYIAKTGKIKPHLYGKFGKEPHPSDDGIWAELYRGFTKHGLKNMMTPSFLLGLTIPAITLMLTALVQKRSLSRSDSREFPEREDLIQEYLQRLQRAMDHYGQFSSQNTQKTSQ